MQHRVPARQCAVYGYSLLLFGPFELRFLQIPAVVWFANAFYLLTSWLTCSATRKQFLWVLLPLQPELRYLDMVHTLYPADEGSASHELM